MLGLSIGRPSLTWQPGGQMKSQRIEGRLRQKFAQQQNYPPFTGSAKTTKQTSTPVVKKRMTKEELEAAEMLSSMAPATVQETNTFLAYGSMQPYSLIPTYPLGLPPNSIDFSQNLIAMQTLESLMQKALFENALLMALNMNPTATQANKPEGSSSTDGQSSSNMSSSLTMNEALVEFKKPDRCAAKRKLQMSEERMKFHQKMAEKMVKRRHAIGHFVPKPVNKPKKEKKPESLEEKKDELAIPSIPSAKEFHSFLNQQQKTMYEYLNRS